MKLLMISLGTEIWILMHGPLGFAIGLGGLFFIARNAMISFLEMVGVNDFFKNNVKNEELAYQRKQFTDIHCKIKTFTFLIVIAFVMAMFLYVSIYTVIDTNEIIRRDTQLDAKSSLTTFCVFLLAICAIILEALIARQRLRRAVLLTSLK